MSIFDKILIESVMLLAIGFALAIVYFRNPVNAVLSFIATFIISACFFIYLGIEFIAIIYLLVYIGAVAVLFLFIVMLLTTSEQYPPIVFNGPVLVVCAAFLYWLIHLAKHFKVSVLVNLFDQSVTKQFSIVDNNSFSHATLSSEMTEFFQVVENSINAVSVIEHAELFENGLNKNLVMYTNDIGIFSSTLYGKYSFLFLMLAVILLVALVGVIVLTIHHSIVRVTQD